MTRTIYFIILLLLSTQARAEFVGFAKGNDMKAVSIQGRVQVFCNGFNGSATAVYTCREVVLDPQAYDYFLGPKNPKADKVELEAFHEDGSSRSKMVAYDGVQGRSREAFNLWISTLFQKPLLENGVNTIRYRVYSGTNFIEMHSEGSFQAVVQRGTPRQCPQAQYNSTDSNDCNSQYSICQKYFTEYNNCR
ncbi:MAG: hypothetical protein AAGB31_09925 [Bdellovibrio sp.]